MQVIGMCNVYKPNGPTVIRLALHNEKDHNIDWELYLGDTTEYSNRIDAYEACCNSGITICPICCYP